uniref:Interleukin-7 n=1 Tax=Cyanistes caeruleus TaxID=156563 RepID=A0A8C0ZEC3_CYACU
MYPQVFLLLLSSGVSSYFLPQKEMPHLLNETKYSLIDEMLCLLEAENGSINVNNFSTSLTPDLLFEMISKRSASKSSSNDKSCLKKAKTNFSQFKESLQEFLRWVNEKFNCSSIGRSNSALYLDGKCSCQDPWKSHRGLG